MAATKAGDTGTVIDLMTDDVLFMVPGQEPFGKEKFAELSKMRPVEFDGSAEVLEVHVQGDMAWIRVRIKLTMKLVAEQAPLHRSGYTLTLLRRCDDGKWRIFRDANLVT